MKYKRTAEQERFLRRSQRAQSHIQPLVNHLESLVPNSIVVPRFEEDLIELIERGEIIDVPVRTIPMQDRRCHSNTACMNHCFPQRIAVQTGWVLSDEDGLWRQHSWGLDIHHKEIIETTHPRGMYYGITLTGERLKEFNWDNIHDKCKCSDIEKLLDD